MNLVGLALLLTIAAPGDRPDLSGVVTSKAGAPLAGAHVLIYEAGVRQGTNPFCPSCYADCGKRAESAPDGSFRVASLDPTLIFRVLVIAEGHRPTFVEKVDPAKGPIKVAVEPMDLDKVPADKVVRGVVVDEGGRPVAGASVRAYMFRTDEFSGYSPGIVDPLAITNLKGEFALTSRSPIRDLDLEVEARGLAPAHFPGKSPRSTRHRLRMGVGAEVTGRLIFDGKPLGGVSVGLVQANRSMDHFLGATEIGTDADGRFRFSNVAPNDEFYAYGIMTSLDGRGAVKVRPVKVGAAKTKADVGDLAVEPGHRIAGRVLTSDDKPIPPGTRILVSREEAWDSRSAVLDADGRFAMSGLPTERVSLSVVVRGYRLSDRNKSLDTDNPFQLKGLVDGDIDGLKILLEPGK